MLTSLRLAVAALVAAANVQAIPQVASQSVAVSSASPTPSAGSGSGSGGACNNSPTLCKRQYNAIIHLGAHNSAFLRDSSTGNSIAGNQFKNATEALDAGIRLLQAQVHKSGSVLELCHTSCSLLDAGPLENWLSSINSWVTSNPNDVVTILLVNSDEAAASEFGPVFESSGLSKISYKPQSGERTASWPTLQSMIDQKTRVVNFITNIEYSASTPYLLAEFDHIFETPFEVTQLTGFNCTADRPSAAKPATSGISKNFMGFVNHFKYQSVFGSIMTPDVDNITTVNSPSTAQDGNLGKHINSCKTEWTKIPNFVLVDFWDRGDPIAAVDTMNGVNDVTGRKQVTSSDNASTGIQVGEGRNLELGALVAFISAAVLLI